MEKRLWAKMNKIQSSHWHINMLQSLSLSLSSSLLNGKVMCAKKTATTNSMLKQIPKSQCVCVFMK
ncbi:hypothetical protein DERF_000755 [Dermatophagoides farinae]|uniref:Uncharacterized protein n=1 Tax=Dermatophagoides farinae TaxID=6954 RepID=A0A922LCM4_DERFA|nr:hypothetical protein DERF_000755 [Dermatophagoides farinae]